MAAKKKNKGQALFRLVTVDGIPVEPRKKAQSTSGRITSHGTSPLDSRSINIASDSRHRRVPYATLRKWPSVVSHLSAKPSASESERVFKKESRSMTHYHQTVIGRQSPFGEFTKWCPSNDNKRMVSEEDLALRRLRIKNLSRFLEREGISQSELARRYADYRSKSGEKPIKPSFFSDLLREKKSFGEKLATGLERTVGLKKGQLSEENSPLEMELAEDPEEAVLDFLREMSPKQRAKFLERLKERHRA